MLVVKIDKWRRSKKQDSCWRDCIANMLGLKPNYVPDFVEKYGGDWVNETAKWLDGKDIKLIRLDNEGVIKNTMPIGLHMRCGRSVGNVRHACLYYANSLVYDPIGPKGFGLMPNTIDAIFFMDGIYVSDIP